MQFYSGRNTGYLPSHHAQNRPDSISRDNSLAVRESIKALLEDPDLALVQSIQRLMVLKLKTKLSNKIYCYHFVRRKQRVGHPVSLS